MVQTHPMRSTALALLFWLTAELTAQAQAARDPQRVWRTLRSEHFEVHYHEPLEPSARRIVTVAERAQRTLAAALGHAPSRRTHIVLTDDTDSANGSATALPFNAIRLYATAPDDLSPLGDYDDWLTTLVTHEHTHVVQLDSISGLPAIINAIFGRIYAPNQIAPRWFLEGLAVFEESEHTAGGRLRSTMFDMYLRMDALEDRLVHLDQVSHSVDRWPHGNLPYLYGAHFIEFIAEKHGKSAVAEIVRAYGNEPIPYGLNRQAIAATGRSFVDLYADFLEETRRRYRERADALRAQGLREGVRLTRHGEDVRTPRFLPDGRLVYGVSDGRSISQLRLLDLPHGGQASTLVSVAGLPAAAPHPDGRSILYSALDNHRDLYFFHDLFRYDIASGRATRLTHGLRAQDPDVSPDGRRVVFTAGSAGTTHLMIAELRDVPATMRTLLAMPTYGQVYSPRWSPDGRAIAFSAWSAGGYRDVRVIEVDTASITEITHDRALDTGPIWTPDGKALIFSSDRTGIANLYRFTLDSGELRQITRVLGGAYAPTLSPDGRHVVYLGYSTYGFDLYAMDLDPSLETPAAPYEDTRPAPTEAEEAAEIESTDYRPWETWIPYSYLVDARPDGFGTQIGVSARGSDVVGLYAWSARVGISAVNAAIGADATVSMNGSPFGWSLRLSRAVTPRGGLVVEGRDRTWIEEGYSADMGGAYVFPAPTSSQSLSAAYSFGHLGKAALFGGELDPNDPPPTVPDTGFFSQLRLGWRWSNVQRYRYDISESEGTSVALSVAASDPLIGSRFHALQMSWAIEQYVTIPWLGLDINGRHQVALRYAGGISEGDLGRRGVFAVGGYPDTNPLDGLLNNRVLGGAALRGYNAASRAGTQFHLVQAEYRFPIWRTQFGIDTLPIFIHRIYGLGFVDVGDATSNAFDVGRLRWGVGAEVLVDFSIGYYLGYTLRLGLAQGLSTGGQTQFYGHLGVPF